MPLTIRKRGGNWYARGTIPSRQASGAVVNVRVERSLQTSSRNDALQRASDLDRYYWNLAYGKIEKAGPTFSEAALTYIKTKGKSDRFINALIGHFKDTALSEIGQAEALDAAAKLYPRWKPSSINRAIFTPLMAIGVRGLTRPSVTIEPLDLPPETWVRSVIAGSPKNLAALVVFITSTGRRVGEAIALEPKNIDEAGYAHIGKTKTGKPVLVKVPELCWLLLKDAKPHERLFGYYSIPGAYSTLTGVCRRLGLPRYRLHAIGRHSFATRALKAGRSIKWVQEAGGWASPQVPMARYLHLEQSEVARDVDEMGEAWGKRLAPKSEDFENTSKTDKT